MRLELYMFLSEDVCLYVYFSSFAAVIIFNYVGTNVRERSACCFQQYVQGGMVERSASTFKCQEDVLLAKLVNVRRCC